MEATLVGETLRHVSEWARRNRMGGVTLSPSLLDALDQADRGAELVTLGREAAEDLFAIDVDAHGYGPARALRGDRDNCRECAAIGEALEAMLPKAAVRRRKGGA